MLDERKTKEHKLTENNLAIEMNTEKQQRRDAETKINKMTEERLFSLKLDLAKEKKLREEAEEKY